MEVLVADAEMGEGCVCREAREGGAKACGELAVVQLSREA